MLASSYHQLHSYQLNNAPSYQWKLQTSGKIWNDLKNRDPTCPAFVCCLSFRRRQPHHVHFADWLSSGDQVRLWLQRPFLVFQTTDRHKYVCLSVCICVMHALIFAASVFLNVHVQRFAGFMHALLIKMHCLIDESFFDLHAFEVCQLLLFTPTHTFFQDIRYMR